MKLNKKVLLLLTVVVSQVFGQSNDVFTVKDIQIQGLKRVASGAVYIHLPVEVGETIAPSQIQQLIKNLYASENFDAVEVHRQDDVLVIVVHERPTISNIVFEGNELIKTDLLETNLTGLGISQGESLDRTKLAGIERHLQEVYYSQGLYNAKVYAQAIQLPRNRVELQLEFVEGEPASIEQINFVGNVNISDSQLRDLMKSTDELPWWNFFGDLAYQKQVLAVDQEAIKTFYQNQGYIRFQIRSTEVSISPDKTKIYVTMNIDEGAQYTVEAVNLYGDVLERELESLSEIEIGQRYQVKQVAATETAITQYFGNLGFAFAKVNTTPVIDDATKTVKLNLFVESGSQIYVRQINFSGNSSTKDTVLRREMRQLEGSSLNQSDLDISKERLQRLGFFQQVEYKLLQVAGEPEFVDVLFSVQPRQTGSLGFSFGVGTGFTVGLNVSEKNIFGTGIETIVAFQKSETRTMGQLMFRDPYFFDNGASLSLSGSATHDDTTDSESVLPYLANSYSIKTKVGFPVNETNRFSVFVEAESSTLESERTYEYMLELKRMYGDVLSFDNILLGAAWLRNTQNRYLFPTSGSRQEIELKASMPFSDLDYFAVNASSKHYFPLSQDHEWAFSTSISGSYINTYGMEGDQRQLLPYRNLIILPMRGFAQGRLGPKAYTIKDNEVAIDKTLGGNAYYLGKADLIFPIPFMSSDLKHRIRTSLFLDAGSIWNSRHNRDSLDNLPQAEQDKVPDYSNAWALKSSFGVSVKMLTPFGLIGINLAKTLLKDENDESQFFQLDFNTSF
jgi:outer membrane protein insertion porin family